MLNEAKYEKLHVDKNINVVSEPRHYILEDPVNQMSRYYGLLLTIWLGFWVTVAIRSCVKKQYIVCRDQEIKETITPPTF